MLLFIPQCCRPRLWQSKKSQLYWAVPYAVYFCQPRAHGTAWEIGTGDKAGVGCKRSKTLQREQESLVVVDVLLLGRTGQVAKSIFGGDIITSNDLQPQQELNGFSGQAPNLAWFTQDKLRCAGGAGRGGGCLWFEGD